MRIATWNVNSIRQRLPHLTRWLEESKPDIVCLQEVRSHNEGEARRFSHTQFGPMGWPSSPQADYLAPEGYEVAYRTNAITRQGEHGNALLSRWPLGDIGHHDVSDHAFEQRGLLHVPVQWQGTIRFRPTRSNGFHSSRISSPRR